MDIIEYNTVQASDFITASYKLTPNEQQILLAVLNKYQHMDDFPQICQITVPEFQSAFPDNHQCSLKELKKAVNTLYERDAYYYKSEDIGWRNRWVQFIDFNGVNQTITLEFSQKIRPFLPQLKQILSSHKLNNMVPLKSINAIRLFQFIEANYDKGQIQIPVAEVRDILSLEKKYEMVSRLKERVLEPAQKELNNKLGLNLKIKQVKNGRLVSNFRFTWTIVPDNIISTMEL